MAEEEEKMKKNVNGEKKNEEEIEEEEEDLAAVVEPRQTELKKKKAVMSIPKKFVTKNPPPFAFEDPPANIGPVFEPFENSFSKDKKGFMYKKRLRGNPPFGFLAFKEKKGSRGTSYSHGRASRQQLSVKSSAKPKDIERNVAQSTSCGRADKSVVNMLAERNLKSQGSGICGMHRWGLFNNTCGTFHKQNILVPKPYRRESFDRQPSSSTKENHGSTSYRAADSQRGNRNEKGRPTPEQYEKDGVLLSSLTHVSHCTGRGAEKVITESTKGTAGVAGKSEVVEEEEGEGTETKDDLVNKKQK